MGPEGHGRKMADVKGFRNGLTPVKTKTGWGIMDHQGQWIVEPQYKDITLSIYNFDTKCYNMKNENWEMGDDNG